MRRSGGVPSIVAIYVQQLQDLASFVNLARSGFELPSPDSMRRFYDIARRATVAADAPRILELLGVPATEEDEQVADDGARFANEQEAQGFPFLFNLAAIRAASILEAAVGDFATYVVRERPIAMKGGESNRVVGDLVGFLYADDEERAALILDGIAASVKRENQVGIGYFECILAKVGLGGSVDDDVRTSVLELTQLRNAVVHKNARADDRVVRHCPWLGLSTNQEIKISRERFFSYIVAIHVYLIELQRRLLVIADWPRGIAHDREVAEWEQALATLTGRLREKRRDLQPPVA